MESANKELRKLKRPELLELLVDQTKQTEALQAENDELRRQLESRTLQVENAGSLAEASLVINGVFLAAQASAEQYLANLRERSQQREEMREALLEEYRSECEKVLVQAKERAAETNRKAEELSAAKIAAAEEECNRIRMQTELECQHLREEADAELAHKKAEAEAYWQQLSTRLEAFYAKNKGLREMLDSLNG